MLRRLFLQVCRLPAIWNKTNVPVRNVALRKSGPMHAKDKITPTTCPKLHYLYIWNFFQCSAGVPCLNVDIWIKYMDAKIIHPHVIVEHDIPKPWAICCSYIPMSSGRLFKRVWNFFAGICSHLNATALVRLGDNGGEVSGSPLSSGGIVGGASFHFSNFLKASGIRAVFMQGLARRARVWSCYFHRFCEWQPSATP